MASVWGARGAGRKNQFRVKSLKAREELNIPSHFQCPISLELMRDPVTLPTGITYDRQSIEMWLELGNGTCPVTKRAVEQAQDHLVPNHALRRMIQDWCVAHRKYGVERIPTPRIPATAAQVEEMLSEVATSARRGDAGGCREMVGKIRNLAKESERNRRCVTSNGAAAVLSAAFVSFARADSNVGRSVEVKEEILGTLTGIFPLGEEACTHLGTPEALHSIVWIAKSGALAGRLNAVLVVKELVHKDRSLVDIVAGTEGMADALVKLIREPISPQATKASLVAIFYLVSSDASSASRFVDMGLVSLVLEILVESDKSMTEKALGVLDALCGSKKGRDDAYGHALTVPILVKKIFRVSELATQFSVSALWNLCKNYPNEWEAEAGQQSCLVEALQVGAFQKLLLLLQVGCGETTKAKTSELLKQLNASRGKVECVDSADFKGMKRPF